MFLVHQYGGVHRACAGMLAEVDDRREGVPFVEDVVDDQHITVDEGDFRLGLPEQFAAGGLVAVTGRMQVGQFEGEVEQREQLAGEDQAAVHHAEDHRVGLAEIAVDRLGDATDGCLDLVVVEQAVGFRHDLADVREIDGHGASPWLG